MTYLVCSGVREGSLGCVCHFGGSGVCCNFKHQSFLWGKTTLLLLLPPPSPPALKAPVHREKTPLPSGSAGTRLFLAHKIGRPRFGEASAWMRRTPVKPQVPAGGLPPLPPLSQDGP